MTNFRGKKVLVMGLGLHEGGIGTVKFLIREGAKVTVTDLRSRNILAPALAELKKYKGVTYVLGRHRKSDFQKTDYIVKNPGVPPHSPYLGAAQKNGIPILNDIGIFFQSCPARIIGVTGTRGKSTAVLLIFKFLNSRYKRVFLGGNIRTSVLKILPKLNGRDWVVLELSSFQLHDMRYTKKSPHIAVFTTLFPEHLNWHKTLNNYKAAKRVIFEFQKKDDYLFINPADASVKKLTSAARSHVIPARLPKKLQPIVDQNLGKHYRTTVGLAIAVARHLKVSEKGITKILKSFRGLEGRQEHITTIEGIRFINDTTATAPEATTAALNRFSSLKKNGKLIVIAGGMDKGISYKALARGIKKYVDVLILLPGTATAKLKKDLRTMDYGSGKLHAAKSMRDAVKKAYASAQRGDWVILSPGAASFNLFTNEFDRGKQFVDAVNKLN